MKRLVLIGLVIGVTAVAVPNASAKPTGLSAAELRALTHDQSAPALPRAWGPRIIVSPVNPVNAPVNLADEFHIAGVNPPYGGLPTFVGSSASTSSDSTDFQWSDAGVGAAGALALLALAGSTTLGIRRYRGHLRPS